MNLSPHQLIMNVMPVKALLELSAGIRMFIKISNYS